MSKAYKEVVAINMLVLIIIIISMEPTRSKQESIDSVSQLQKEFQKLQISSSKFAKKYQRIEQLMNIHNVPKDTFTLHDFQAIHQLQTQIKRLNRASSLQTKQLLALLYNECLNDQLINSYLKLLKPPAHLKLLNTYFTLQFKKSKQSIERVLAKNEVSRNDEIIIPVHCSGYHWVFVKVKKGELRVYDSLEGSKGVSKAMISFFEEYYQSKCQVIVEKDFPRQKNGTDCGVFMISGIQDIINSQQKWTFSQKDMYLKRLEVAKTLMTLQNKT